MFSMYPDHFLILFSEMPSNVHSFNFRFWLSNKKINKMFLESEMKYEIILNRDIYSFKSIDVFQLECSHALFQPIV